MLHRSRRRLSCPSPAQSTGGVTFGDPPFIGIFILNLNSPCLVEREVFGPKRGEESSDVS